MISILSQQSIYYIIELCIFQSVISQLVFKYQAVCQSFNQTSDSMSIIEEEFIQRGYEWSSNCLDGISFILFFLLDYLSKCIYIHFEDDKLSEISNHNS